MYWIHSASKKNVFQNLNRLYKIYGNGWPADFAAREITNTPSSKKLWTGGQPCQLKKWLRKLKFNKLRIAFVPSLIKSKACLRQKTQRTTKKLSNTCGRRG